jgi:hypothetical protein
MAIVFLLVLLVGFQWIGAAMDVGRLHVGYWSMGMWKLDTMNVGLLVEGLSSFLLSYRWLHLGRV